MKTLTLKSTCLLILAIMAFAVSTAYGQTPPPNDNVCNAQMVMDDGIGWLMSSDTATVEPGEIDLEPPFDAGCAPHNWCDGDGITASIWFSFVAPASGAVEVNLCSSTYDTQLAVYSVGDCADFSTFSLLDGNDDSGTAPDGTTECGAPGAAFASWLNLECLTVGETYYVLVDYWSNDGGVDYPDGALTNITVTEITPGAGPVINAVTGTDPDCQGGSNGTASVDFDAVFPGSILWSTGDTDATIGGLAAGTYTVTVTDACGNTTNDMVTLADGAAPASIVLGSSTVLPAYCGMGYATVEVTSGTAPFTYSWSNGTTGALVLADAGTYDVTVTDLCGNPEAVTSVTIPGSADAGADQALDANCMATLGGAPSGNSVIVDNSLTYNLDQTIDGGVACRGGGFISDNSFYRAFDIATDLGVSGAYQLDAIEIAIFSAEAGPNGGGFQPLTMRLYSIDQMDLTVATLTLVDEVLVSLPDIAAPQYWSFPTNYEVPAGGLFAVEVFNPDGTDADVQNSLAIGVNETATTNGNPTYIASAGCGLGISPFSSIGFADEMIVNLVQYQPYSGGYTYSWTPSTGLDNPSAANPVVTSVDAAPITYTLTVTDDNGCTGVSTVNVASGACTIGIVDPANHSFAITPNPSNGLFQIQNDGNNREVSLEVFDIQGKLMTQSIVTLGAGQVHNLNITNYASGMYILKLTNDNQTEVHKLIVE